MSDLPKKYLVNVVGPTAVGKTSIAIQLAKQLNTEVLSFDSRQFYREMSIGTAKPDQKEMDGIKHHFIDSHSLSTKLSAGKFEKEALILLSNLFKEKDVVVTVGGSGLFIDALCFGLDELPPIPEKIRNKWNEKYETKGLEHIQQLVKQLDPVFFDNCDQENPHRLLRVLETHDVSGQKLSDLQKKEAKTRDFETIWVGLNMDRDLLYDRINQRVDLMMKNGLLEEVMSLKEHWQNANLKTVGYQEFIDQDLIDKNNESEKIAHAVELVKRNSRRYAKRQLTWFRRNEKITWFSPDDFPEIQLYINSQIS